MGPIWRQDEPEKRIITLFIDDSIDSQRLQPRHHRLEHIISGILCEGEGRKIVDINQPEDPGLEERLGGDPVAKVGGTSLSNLDAADRSVQDMLHGVLNEPDGT